MNENFGRLFQPNVEMLRRQFSEMARLIGVKVAYQFPLRNKNYSLRGELKSSFSEQSDVFCIFNEHIDQKTSKLLGWDAELQDRRSLISVPIDLPNLQVGCLFTVPGAFGDHRTFRVVEMSTIALYPASVTCALVLEYENTLPQSEIIKFNNSNFNLLKEGD